MDWLMLLLLGLASSNLLPGDKRAGHHHHHHHHGDHDDHPQHHLDHGGQHHPQHNQQPQHQHHLKEEELDNLKTSDSKNSKAKGKSKQKKLRSGKNLSVDFSSAVLDEETGLKCVKSETSVARAGRESLLTCRHSSVTICHVTYVTRFTQFRPRVCEDTYSKRCTIVFSRQARNVTEEACYTPYTKACDAGPRDARDTSAGEPVCVTVSDTSCVTRYEAAAAGGEHAALTSCDRVPQTLCSEDTRCRFVQGEPVCRNKTVAVVREVPEENCDLEPATVCRTANKLVPHLQPQQQCADQPRQVCSFGVRAAGTREAPLVTKWCYNHTDPATQPPAQPVFGEKLIKKDRKPKSNKFKHKNIPSGLVISRNPLVVPEIHNEVIDDVPANEDVNDRKKPKKPSIFGDKLISQNLLPPKFHDDQDRSARKIIKTTHNEKNNEDEFSFIEAFLKTAKQDPESSPPKIDKSINEDDGIVDAELISDVFLFDDDEVDGVEKSSGNIGLPKIEFSAEQIPDLGTLAKVVNHEGDSPVSKTIIIQNNPRAHKAFGVRNPPKKFSSEFRTHFKTKSRESKAAAAAGAGAGQSKSRIVPKNGAKTISRDQQNDHIDFLSGDDIIQEPHNLFGFGISQASDEEKEQYRPPVSSEFHFQPSLNNVAPPPALALIFRASHGQQPAAGPGAVSHQERLNTNTFSFRQPDSSGPSSQNKENFKVAGDSLGPSPNVFRSIDQNVVSPGDTASISSFSSSALSSSGPNDEENLGVPAASVVTDAGADNAAPPAHHRHAAHSQPSQSGPQTPLSDHNNDNQGHNAGAALPGYTAYNTPPAAPQITQERPAAARPPDTPPPSAVKLSETAHAPGTGNSFQNNVGVASADQAAATPPPGAGFRAPSTLLYGFVPITTTQKVTFPGAGAGAGGYRPYKQPSFAGGPATAPINYKPSYAPPGGGHPVLEAISRLLAPLTRTLGSLLRG